MSKSDFIKKCRENASMPGYCMAPMMLFELFEESEDIPVDWVDIFAYKLEISQPVKIYCGKLLAEELKEAAKNYT